MNSLTFSWIHYQSTNLSSLTRIQYNFLSLSRILYDSTWWFANSVWFYLIFREFTISLLFFRSFTIKSLIYNEFTIFLANSSWIQCLVREFTTFYANIPWIHNLPREFTTIFCLNREFSTTSRDVSRIHYESSIFRNQN